MDIKAVKNEEMDEHPNCDVRFSDRFTWPLSQLHVHYVHFYSCGKHTLWDNHHTGDHYIHSRILIHMRWEARYIHSHILGMMHEVHAAWTGLFVFLVRWENMSIFTHLFYHDVCWLFTCIWTLQPCTHTLCCNTVTYCFHRLRSHIFLLT